MAIYFFENHPDFRLTGKNVIKSWIRKTVEGSAKKTGNINIIFVTDNELKGINQEFLKRDYYTDIITFDYSKENIIEGDLYLSIDRIAENSKKFRTETKKELLRVIIHGILHLLGYNDHSDSEKIIMRKKEDECLEIISFEEVRTYGKI